jgi:hypothetical protein
MTELFFDHNSDFFFARPSLIGGLSRILDLGGTLKIYNESPSEADADIKAISEDWKAVGNCLRSAIESLGLQESEWVKLYFLEHAS